MKLRIITKNIQSIQRYSFLRNRFYGLWYSQRPPVSIGLKLFRSPRNILRRSVYLLFFIVIQLKRRNFNALGLRPPLDVIYYFVYIEFQILILLSGIVEGTGMACQVRTSYVCSEILWGYRFEPAITRLKEQSGYLVDYDKVHKTYEVSSTFLF